MCRCYNAAGKSNYHLLARGKDQIIPELNGNYRQLSFVQGYHSKLGDDSEKALKDISETNKVGNVFSRQKTEKSTE